MSFQYYLSVKGEKQGQFNGDSSKPGRHDKWIEALSFQMGSDAPFDPGSGRASGRRTFKPLSITKETGAASPQLLSAHWNSEILDEVVLEIVGGPGTGSSEAVVERITLTNAIITGFRQHFSTGGTRSGKPHTKFDFEFQEISFRSY